MEHVKNNLFWNTNTVIPTETNFFERNQEHFLLLFQMDNFSAMQGVVLLSQRLVLLEESSPCLPFRWAEWGFLLHLPSLSRQSCWWKESINARSKKSVYIQLIIFPGEIDIVQMSRHLKPSCVHYLCTYTWKYLVPHFMCSLLVRGNWNSR